MEQTPTQHRIRRRVLFATALPLLGALSGAIIQQNVDSFFKRPKPSVQSIAVSLEAIAPISEVLSPLGGLSAKQVTVPPTLVELTTKSDWISTIQGKLELPQYLAKLRRAKDEASELLDALKHLEEDLKRWPNPVRDNNADDASVIFEIVRADAECIEPHVFGETEVGTAIFKGPSKDHAGKQRLITVNVGADGDFFVTRGRANLPIVWTEEEKKHPGFWTEQLKSVSQRLADAVSFCDAEDLASLRESLLRLLSNEMSVTRELHDSIEKELANYSRWFVRVTLSNDGKEPVAFSPKAILYVRTSGRTVKGETSVERAMVHDARIELTAVQPRTMVEKGITFPAGFSAVTEPILVEGGKAISVTLQSEKMVPDTHDDSPGLLEVFRKGDAPCRVLLERLGKSQTSFEFLWSPDSNFQAAFDKSNFPSADKVWQK